MKTYADTSALMSLFLGDKHAPASAAAFNLSRSVVWTPWQKVEFGNALRALVNRRLLTLAQLADIEKAVRACVESGILRPVPLPAYQLWNEAETLSRLHTPTLGVRTLDLLHVAAARVLRCRDFIGFDNRQSALVKACGLRLVTGA